MSSSNPSVDMDVDGPSAPSNGPGTLKRCSSAPMINDSNSFSVMATANQQNSNTREQQNFNLFGASLQPRARRSSFSVVPGSPPIPSGLRRIHELRQEEDIRNLRELAHERDTHHAMLMSQSCEDLSLMGESPGESKTKPLHVHLPSFTHQCNSPSPTRLSSPGFQSPTRASRTIIRRSASPVLRPSPLGGAKRKLEDDKSDLSPYPRAKRVYSYSAVDRGLLTTTSLPGSLSSVGTPESLSSADSPGFNFRSVDSPSPNRAQQPEPMVVSKGDERMNDSPS